MPREISILVYTVQLGAMQRQWLRSAIRAPLVKHAYSRLSSRLTNWAVDRTEQRYGIPDASPVAPEKDRRECWSISLEGQQDRPTQRPVGSRLA